MQRIEVAGGEIALRMRCRKNQRGQALAETQFAVREFFNRWRRYTLHRKAGVQIGRTLFLIIARRVGNRIVVTRGERTPETRDPVCAAFAAARANRARRIPAAPL